jgi:SAM-dependent methyltransferase
VHADTIRALGWQLVGVEPSAGQVAIARDRMRVVRGDGARLPLADSSVEAVVAVLIHTDVDDWDAVVAEAARVLMPGGRFAYVGVHPCFVSPYAVAGDDSVVLVPGYADRRLVFSSPAFLGGATGLRGRVGVRHRTLADVLGAIPRAGLSLTEIREDGGSTVPGRLGLAAVRPG